MNKTISFTIIIGINKGYFHNNINKNGIQIIAEEWQKIAKKLYDETRIYVSCVMHPGKAVYNAEWGCPVGGEDIITITGTANPKFAQDLEQWEDIVIKIAKHLKAVLNQSTVTVEFHEVKNFVYLNEELK
ncbi:hypothetical protein U732_123 [Clostridium argentinense CDC 2741]|uniref:Uncharacterized protein n=2 Tax=Clostridium argentinense TaxID=29341 RepID=A0A0C1R2Z0_9CLOT|nr:hypothetical protein [Clostridium argentinense]ARC83144.1 hypothetical protein RSJ17_00395 [Clostridium argentinense]KIE44811.1 hypothetical protein U732_123 [Clostridium argentinense CDC 2741]NFF41615.1 hypothetical protein [Clostridium argentinense]NFP52315.1 hypothetical protein [Clostridium argentinense]NFP74672.1 hypothetical protein [Clostridium argentinense]